MENHRKMVIYLEAIFPYSENLRIPCFSRIPDLGLGLLLWREQLGHGKATECPSTAFYPPCRSKQLRTLNELKATLVVEFPHLSTEGQGCQS